MQPPPATATSGQRERAAQPFRGVRTLIRGSLAGGIAKAGWGNGRDTEGRDKGDEDSVLKASDRRAGKTQSARTTKGQSKGTSNPLSRGVTLNGRGRGKEVVGREGLGREGASGANEEVTRTGMRNA